ADLALMRGTEQQLIGKAAGLVEKNYQRCGQRVDTALLIAPVEDFVGCTGNFGVGGRLAAGGRKLATHPRSYSLDQRLRRGVRQVVKPNQALAEAVAATSPTKDQGHRGRRDRTIIVTYQTLEHARFAATAPRSC